jgi:hypothetical protein
MFMRSNALRALGWLFLAAIAVGCASTRQARHVEHSGFLEDYTRLSAGPEGGAALVYRSPGADLSRYDKILLDPVAVWRPKDSKEDEISRADLQAVANRFYSVLHLRLSKDYEMVPAPGRQTLRITVALTKAEQSMPVLDTISSVLPQALIISGLKKLATGKPAFVGEAAAELKMSDAETGAVLFEAVDDRVGAKNLSGVTHSWDDVDEALQYWSERLAFRLCEERGGKGCTAPSQ